MAISLTISQRELARQAAEAFEGQTFKLFLATQGSLTAESDLTAWEAAEVSGNGYAAITGTIGTGSYSTTNARYELPAISGTFTATGSGFTYDTVVLAIGSATGVHSINVESPSITLAASQSKSYTLTLAQDD